MGSISLREFIRWLPGEACEPTSTIVLTSPGRRFVDIRIIRPELAVGTWPSREEKLPLHQLDWAIAGTSSSTPTVDNNVTKGHWSHWISSRTTHTKDLCDEGYNYLQYDGKILEKGVMVNPDTGLRTEYEELWSSEEPLPTTSSRTKTVVLQYEAGDDTKGLVVLLGHHCQGFLRRGNNITVERWRWTVPEGWARVITIGDDTLPCSKILERPVQGPRENVKVGDDSWQVIEFAES